MGEKNKVIRLRKKLEKTTVSLELIRLSKTLEKMTVLKVNQIP